MNDRPIHHLCYIVDDIPKAVDHWVEATGAGPFFRLFLSLAGAAEQPDEFVTDVDDATEANLRGVSR
jgi:hypothetical protein